LICPDLKATLELGEHKDPIRSSVGSIDLREQSVWPRRTEQALGEFEPGALQFLRQPRALAEAVPMSPPCDPQGGSQSSAND
jgi:hypothetical protein